MVRHIPYTEMLTVSETYWTLAIIVLIVIVTLLVVAFVADVLCRNSISDIVDAENPPKRMTVLRRIGKLSFIAGVVIMFAYLFCMIVWSAQLSYLRVPILTDLHQQSNAQRHEGNFQAIEEALYEAGVIVDIDDVEQDSIGEVHTIDSESLSVDGSVLYPSETWSYYIDQDGAIRIYKDSIEIAGQIPQLPEGKVESGHDQ